MTRNATPGPSRIVARRKTAEQTPSEEKVPTAAKWEGQKGEMETVFYALRELDNKMDALETKMDTKMDTTTEKLEKLLRRVLDILNA